MLSKEQKLKNRIHSLLNTNNKLKEMAIKGFRSRMEDYNRQEAIYFRQFQNKIISERIYSHKIEKIKNEKIEMIQQYKDLNLLD